MSVALHAPITLAEFLAWEERQALRYKFDGFAPVAMTNGVKFGGKPILTPHRQKDVRKRIDADEPQRSVARSYNVSQATISRL